MISFLRLRQMIRKEVRQLFRDPKTKRIIFIAPVLQLILFGYAVNTDVRHLATFVVDHDRTAESRLVVGAFTASEYFDVAGRDPDPDAMARALDRGAAAVGLAIPAGFAADLAAGRSPAVQILVDGTSSNTATVAQGYATRIVQEFGRRRSEATGGAGLAADGGRAGTPGTPAGIVLEPRAWYNPSLEHRVYNEPAVIGVIVVLMCLLLTSMGVVREREMGTLEQLLVSPLRPSELILGKTIPVAGVAMIQLAIVTAVALLWFHIPLRGSVLAMIIAALVFILSGLAAGLLISTLASTQQEAFLVMYLFILPTIVLSGFLYPVDTMPEVFQVLTLANPLRHFLEVVREIFLKGAGFAEVWQQLLVLLGMAVAGLTYAVHRFRVRIS
ncbi:MAG TPA: ABC transporter permease [Longimicrobiales bacterium]|nr:ABC transporter permease [Longimicrobiales bacterium]